MPRRAPSSVGDALTRGQARPPTDIAGLIRTTYGENRIGRPNTAAAAADLGVSQRQVQRWLKQPPAKSAHVDDLRGRAQAAADTPQRRRAALGSRREQRMRRRGALLRLAGRFRVSSDSRNRALNYRFDGDALSPVIDAYLQGGESAARGALQEMLDNGYAAGIHIERLDRVEFRQ